MANEIVTQNFSNTDIELLSKYAQDNDFASSDLSYAWLRIAQTNSPQATKGHESYIPGLEAGQWFNSLTGRIYGSDINVVYQKFFHSFSVHEPDGKNKFLRSMSEEEFEKMINVSIGMKPLWENALGKDWEQIMTREKLRALYEKL
jgi:hypothetical protein